MSLRRLRPLLLCLLVGAMLPALPARSEIVGTSGAVIEVAPPASVERDGTLESKENIFAFDEQQDVTLAAPLAVNITAPGVYDDTSDLTPGTIPAGAKVSSHYVFGDHPGTGGCRERHILSGTVVTDSDILGIAVQRAELDASDFLGAPGTVYPDPPNDDWRKLELDAQDDVLVWQVDNRTVFVQMDMCAHGDHVRIITVEPLTPTVATQVHDPSHADVTGQTLPAGTPVHDQATVSSTGPTPTGTVSFSLFDNGSCSGSPTSVESGVALSGGVAESSTVTPAPGDYSYLVDYSGDSFHAPAQGPCEPFRIDRHGTVVATEVHDAAHNDITGASVPAGTTVHDEATVSSPTSGATPTGVVDFALYGNLSCSGAPISVQQDVPLSGGVAESTPITPAAGDYSYLVHYEGDAVHKPADGPCEPFRVLPPPRTDQGCSPGYWKQPHHFDSWRGYSPGDSFEAVFGRDAFRGSPTLLDALNFRGGGLNQLARQATAALLNAAHPEVGYPYTESQVKQMFQAAFDSRNSRLIEDTKNRFDAANNLGCPLN